jgi:4-amino-4-deoxy-L-arabinose transferase-like glycosyltransferase
MREDWKSKLHTATYSDKNNLLFITALWLLSLVMVYPMGNVPLNDDWSYGLTVKHLIEAGEFRPTGWTSMPLITQALWGYLFCLPFGFSFEALRLSTLTLSLIGIFGSYYLIRELHPSKLLALVIALTVTFNPIYYALSNTFMTDVPFTALTILAATFLVRHLKNNSHLDWIVGAVFCVAATLTRQLALAIPIAFAVAFILKKRFSIRNTILAAAPTLLCISALLFFQYWLTATNRLPALYNVQGKELLTALESPGIILKVIGKVFLAILYLGWFLLPIFIFNMRDIFGNIKNRIGLRFSIIAATFIFLALTAFAWFSGFRIPSPHQGNTIHTAGIGTLTLRDTYFLKLDHVAALPQFFWVLMTIAALVGATILILAIPLATKKLCSTSSDKNNSDQAITWFVLLSVTIYMIPLVIGGFLDRYLVPTIPLVAAGVASLNARLPALPETKLRPRHAALTLLIALFMVFTTCGTHDYFAWNKARWTALHDLTRNKLASPTDIDGGFEFNGLNLYDPEFRTTRDKSWWWVHNDTYLLTFGAVQGYSTIKEYPYKKWMPPADASIYLLQKNNLNPQ